MFDNRSDAGRQLAKRLMDYADREDVLVLGIPRGGVAVAFEVARALRVPLDTILALKIPAPFHKELAVGAIASHHILTLNKALIKSLDIPQSALAAAIAGKEQELRKREQLYRDMRPRIPPAGKTVILVDDGVATGSTTLAAVDALRLTKPAKIIVATPICSPDVQQLIRKAADEVISLETPSWFTAIAQFYRDFSPTNNEEVRRLLHDADRITDDHAVSGTTSNDAA